MPFDLLIPSFIAGIFTFVAPCTLPLVPAFLGIISGVPPSELQDPEKLKKVRWKIFSNALFYVIGFSLVFILFGVFVALLGKIFIIRIWISRIGGVLVILFGLFIMGLLKLQFLSKEKQLQAPRLLAEPNKLNSFFIGALFSLGWSPCVGPLLGSVLLLASTRGTVVQGVTLLTTFSAGLAIPFLLTALFVGRAFSAFGSAKFNKAIKVINKIAGIFLIFLGVLLVSDKFTFVFNNLRGYFQRFEFYQEFINKFL